ncbi:MAG: YbjN domain-containing protein [Cyanobacteria bacterium P01_D01_bin.156]
MMPTATVTQSPLTADSVHTLPLNCPLRLWSTTAEPVSKFMVTAVQLTSVKDSQQKITDCYLTVTVSLEQYEQILEQGLFHLRPEVRGPLQSLTLQADTAISLELGLDSQLLSSAVLESANSEAPVKPVLTQLLAVLDSPATTEPTEQLLQALVSATTAANPDATDSISPWCYMENWYCRSVRQQQGEETVGYTTLWAYTTPQITEPLINSGSDALEQLSTLLNKAKTAVQTEIDAELPQLQSSLSHLSDQLVAALEQVDWETAIADVAANSSKAPIISDVVKQFFDMDDWAYVQLPDSQILQLAFQGDAGRWTCLAQCDNDAEQVVFYSICPLIIPAENYGPIAEFLMRANSGLIIGNFELNYKTGEIRYKTSLDAEGDRLTHALVKNLVYLNVHTLDLYLPGIISILEDGKSPEAAVADLEDNNHERP